MPRGMGSAVTGWSVLGVSSTTSNPSAGSFSQALTKQSADEHNTLGVSGSGSPPKPSLREQAVSVTRACAGGRVTVPGPGGDEGEAARGPGSGDNLRRGLREDYIVA